MKPKLNTEIKRPNLFKNKPTVSRPQYHIFGKNNGVIRGISHRCMFCNALLPINDEVCPTCGSTQISPDLLEDGDQWKKRIKYLGKPNKGYEGT